MVKLTRIYTRGGDQGQTSLGNGQRVPKHALRVEAYGVVDEANAVIGVSRLYTSGEERIDTLLAYIQNDLFDLGADLCTPQSADASGPTLRITQSQVERLEREIDDFNSTLSPLRSFVLPGGTAASAHLHLARTVVRRAERLITALAEHEPIGPAVIAYVNRLSDLLFVLGRFSNSEGSGDVLWIPGANR